MTEQAKRTAGSPMRAGALALCMLAGVSMVAGDVLAQEMRERRTLLDMLFGGPRPREEYRERVYDEPPARVRRPPPRDRASSPSVSRPAAPRRTPSVVQMRTAKPAPVEKLENARRVLVVGDFLAGGMGDELSAIFASSPAIAVDVRSNGSSGLVRDDYYDWFANLPTFIRDVKPATIVIMMGSNDRQMMVINGNKEKFGTDVWYKEYDRRINALALMATRLKIPLLWVGLPAFQSPSLTADFVAFNRMYRNTVEKQGGEFVDVWDGFVDEGGKFVITGVDINGQQARLREPDGIGLTQAGKRKLAFYVEKFVRRHLDAAGPDLMKLDGSNLPALASLPALGIDAGQVRTQPINVTDPDLDGGDTLLGDRPRTISVIETPRDKLIKRGELSDPPLGRVDDYRMPDVTETATK